MAIALVALVTFSGVATAQNVAVLGSPNDPVWNDDVQEKLLGTGFFSTVDIYNISQVTPTLSQLQQYCGVLVYSNGAGYADPFTLGNNLADYVDGGGGVVVAVFANASIPFSGRWDTDNYWTLLPGNQGQGLPLTIGTVPEPGSPLMAGVASFNGGASSYHNSDGGVHGNATIVANWSNGRPLVLRREDLGAPRVDLNFFPPSDAERPDFWDQNTDGDRLMGNALLYVCSQPTPVEATTWGRVKSIYTN
jgi:hypothetical protein